MIEPSRLRDSGDATDRALLGAAVSDAPSAASRAEIAGRLGISFDGGGGPSDPSAPSSGASSVASGSASWGTLLIGLGAIGTVALTVSVMQSNDVVVPPSEPPPVAQPPLLPPTQAQPIASSDPPLIGEPSISERLETRSTQPAHRIRTAVPAIVTTEATLADELAAIDIARNLLPHEPSAAMAQLDAYRQNFPRQRFAQEATVVRIEALIASGDRPRAEALGTAFLEQHGNSPPATRVRRLISHD